ncbi:hypothetical protein NG791_11090 [Laspinema sp. D1]|uniref:hypothetical protein n=1 Tax=Laspinema palackyanum TaxID=3231601 RepID=UPI0034948461|nr:hypothetical protein [Laspinema sp. D2b]
MVTLRIQEIAEAKGMTLEQLSQDCGVSLEKIHQYSAESIEIKEEMAVEIQTIATQLDVTVLELVKPLTTPVAFKLKIQELAEAKGMTLEELSKKAEVHPAIIAFYSTQVISKSKLEEPPFELYLSQISQALECCNEDLKTIAELSLTSLRLQESTQERGLTLKELSKLTNTPYEVIDLMATQPVNSRNFINLSATDGGLVEGICNLIEGCEKKPKNK